MSFIALVDCNNFFVSCERLFDPRLHGKPVVVLSNNDGCIISRSSEAKKLGIPMGAPFFEWQEVIERHKVFVLSSNFSLYGDISRRVMATLAEDHPEFEIYSIDEAFLGLQGIKDPLKHCREVRKKVLQYTGIPVSIGLASTKTLAKVAGDLAKKESGGVFSFLDANLRDQVLNGLPVDEVWGIGSRMKVSLEKKGIFTALQFKNQEDLWIQKHFSVMALRTAIELRGIPCLELEEVSDPKQSLMTSRSFSVPLLTQEELHEKVSSFAARGGEKLREEGSYASSLHVFIQSSAQKEPYYSNGVTLLFPEPTNYTPTLIEAASKGLAKIFRKGIAYKRAGVLLTGLCAVVQRNLFTEISDTTFEKQKKVMELMDKANGRFGYSILHLAAEGNQEVKRENPNRSLCYTTRWDELLKIHI